VSRLCPDGKLGLMKTLQYLAADIQAHRSKVMGPDLAPSVVSREARQIADSIDLSEQADAFPSAEVTKHCIEDGHAVLSEVDFSKGYQVIRLLATSGAENASLARLVKTLRTPDTTDGIDQATAEASASTDQASTSGNKNAPIGQTITENLIDPVLLNASASTYAAPLPTDTPSTALPVAEDTPTSANLATTGPATIAMPKLPKVTRKKARVSYSIATAQARAQSTSVPPSAATDKTRPSTPNPTVSVNPPSPTGSTTPMPTIDSSLEDMCFDLEVVMDTMLDSEAGSSSPKDF